MDNYDIKTIKKELQKELEPKRYEHTIGVASTSFSLALRYGADAEKAYVAGLLHDCAKCYSNDKSMTLCKKYGIKLSKFEKENPALIHSKLGAVVAREKYGINDEEIISSIKYHTTGKADMTLLEKIVFSADYMEPNRKTIPGLEEIRNTIFLDLDKAIYLILNNTLQHLDNKEMLIHPDSQEALNYYTP